MEERFVPQPTKPYHPQFQFPISNFQFPTNLIESMESAPTSAPPPTGKRRRLRRVGSGSGELEDRISGLPDDLLRAVLVRLHCARAAARTSVLSRRWRHVWRHLPELVLSDRPEVFLNAPPASFLDTVDRALAGFAAPALGRLSISMSSADPHRRIPADRVAPWLRFAAERVVGELCLSVPLLGPGTIQPEPQPQPEPTVEETVVLELPVLRGVKRIRVDLANTCRLRLQAPGVFAALTFLGIHNGRMEGTELTAVCAQCPRLRDLHLLRLRLIGVPDVSMRSYSLHALMFSVKNVQRLEVVAPRLEELTVYRVPMEAHVSAPKLAKVGWCCSADYDPHRHRFADIGRRLQLLKTRRTSFAAPLIRQFDEVDNLELEIFISQGAAGYAAFLNETNKIPKCKIFRINLQCGDHALLPSMLYLFRSCNSTKKCSLRLLQRCEIFSCPLPCPCRLEKRRNIDGIALSSLEELEIGGFAVCPEMLKLVEFITCSAAILKRFVILYTASPAAPPLTKEVCAEVRSMCHPNVKVEFYVYDNWNRVRFD